MRTGASFFAVFLQIFDEIRHTGRDGARCRDAQTVFLERNVVVIGGHGLVFAVAPKARPGMRSPGEIKPGQCRQILRLVILFRYCFQKLQRLAGHLIRVVEATKSLLVVALIALCHRP